MSNCTPVEYGEFIGVYPEFSDIVQTAVDYQIMVSNEQLTCSAWGKFWKRAVMLYTAHYLSLRFNITSGLEANGIKSPTSSIGTVTSRSASTTSLSNGVSVSGLVTSDNPIYADLARTSYGLEYLNLMWSVVPCGHIIISKSDRE